MSSRRLLLINKTSNIPNNEIWYTSTDGNTINIPWIEHNPDNNIVSNTYENGKGIVTFNQDITYIIYGAFEDCFNLLQVIIPNSITKIRYGAFYNCSSLTEITIPNSVLEIEYGVFVNCENLKYIKYDGYKKDWYKIQLGNQWNGNTCKKVQCLDGDIYLNEYYTIIGEFDDIE